MIISKAVSNALQKVDNKYQKKFDQFSKKFVNIQDSIKYLKT